MQSRGIHHLDLVVSDVARSKLFYSELLRGLGWSGVLELDGERGETAEGYYAAFFYDPDGIKLEVVVEPMRAATTSLEMEAAVLRDAALETASRAVEYAGRRFRIRRRAGVSRRRSSASNLEA